jgi:hypothetical protein
MPASDEMESGFSRPETPCCREASRSGDLQSPNFWVGDFKSPLLVLVHAGGYAVTAVGPDTRRATAEGAENHDRRDEGE